MRAFVYAESHRLPHQLTSVRLVGQASGFKLGLENLRVGARISGLGCGLCVVGAEVWGLGFRV